MHGLINRSIQSFICDTYGRGVWLDVSEGAKLDFDSFEAMMIYDDALTDAVLGAAVERLSKPRSDVLEDLGTYLVSHPTTDAARRLLRFGGETYEEFLHSLDDLHDRVKLAMPELDFPRLELRDHAPGVFSLSCRWPYEGFGHVVVGLLRGMADDYGALVVLEFQSARPGEEVISIQLLDISHATGSPFSLASGGR
ncbi:heme NO-binding domain-containing protein [Aliiroseovarius sp. YM-037]|uniref:heme NO-binding domain-containing protein n=1 Tax=Aliiroseovarius sp. YM-037 TaxID=3341728 RepID=UPI003A80C80C